MIKRNSKMIDREFLSIIKDITRTEEFGRLREHRLHVNGTVYGHSVKVAYLCYKHHKQFGGKMDIKELVTGALLHDYYLYDLHGDGKKHKLHWFRHPKAALDNALERYPTLTRSQRDMIKHHMFPLTPIPPSTRAGWIICLYDKVAAISDRFGKTKHKKTKKSTK